MLRPRLPSVLNLIPRLAHHQFRRASRRAAIMASTDSEDFGFSSSDEADLVKFASVHEAAGSTRKRPPSPAALSTPKKLKPSAREYPATSSLARRILKETWGYPSFRLRQEEAISRLIHGGSAAVVFPTGGGKSMVYQVPALAFDEHEAATGGTAQSGLTLVVSPLIALMKDQVDALRAKGIEAAALDSSQSRESILHTYDLLRRGELKLLYCAPERLNNEGFVETIKHIRVRLIAVDEAHCISEWGQAFRPDYLKVARFVKEIQAERVLCLTATATSRVAADICTAFDIPPEGLFKTTTYRQNLQLLAESFRTVAEKMPRLKQFVADNPGATIIYVTTHKQAEDVAMALTKAGIRAFSYHAGMTSEKRMEIQDRFMKQKNVTIAATIAFGMGIDKSDIRNIVHYDFPRSLEGYSQEIGRAGRDDLPSKCMFFLCGEDWRQRELFCRTDLPSKQSVRGMLTELFKENKSAVVGDTIEANLHHQSKDWDIKMNTLNLLYAQLELRFGLLRAITPKYSNYTYKPSPSFDAATKSDTSPLAKALKSTATGRVNKTIDVDRVATLARCSRQEAIRKLQDWNDNNFIVLKPSGVVNRYRVLEPLPNNFTETVDAAYEQMEQRELDELRRSKQVIELITSETCFAVGLAAHFGDEVAHGKCGKCQFCVTGRKLVMDETKKPVKVPIDEEKFRAVLDACASRDDPRLLARIAFGISSPRVVAEKCGAKNPVFASMENCDFDELVKRFAGHCKVEVVAK